MRRWGFSAARCVHARRAPRRDDHGLIFRLRFDYPEPFVALPEPKPVPVVAPPADVNHAYHLEGSPRIAPTRVFDDGRATYFVFAPAAELPAVFAIDADRKEAVVNTAIRGGFLVVDRLAAAFVLRQGGEVAQVINDGYPQPLGGPLARKPAKRHRGLFK